MRVAVSEVSRLLTLPFGFGARQRTTVGVGTSDTSDERAAAWVCQPQQPTGRGLARCSGSGGGSGSLYTIRPRRDDEGVARAG